MNVIYFLFFPVSENNKTISPRYHDGIFATFQDAATPSAESIVFLYDSTMFYLFVIITVILILLIEIFLLYSYKNKNSNFDIFVNFTEVYLKIDYSLNVKKTCIKYFRTMYPNLFYVFFLAKESLLNRLQILLWKKYTHKYVVYSISAIIRDLLQFISMWVNLYYTFVDILENSIKKTSQSNVIQKWKIIFSVLKYYNLSNNHIFGWNLKTISLILKFSQKLLNIRVALVSSVVDFTDIKQLYVNLANSYNIKKLILCNMHITSQFLISINHISSVMDSRLWIKDNKLSGLDYMLTNKYKEVPVFWAAQRYKHDTKLEFWWTVIPGIILIIIGIPALATIYILDEMITPAITIKANGHQWYWTYNYGLVHKDLGLINYSFDSRMLNDDDLKLGDLRLLEVDYWLLLPINTQIRFLVTGEDVIHSFTVPSFGIKIDGVPGRLNEVPLFIKRKGIYYGQCSELCGVNHGFMPIVVQSVSRKLFSNFFSCITHKV